MKISVKMGQRFVAFIVLIIVTGGEPAYQRTSWTESKSPMVSWSISSTLPGSTSMYRIRSGALLPLQDGVNPSGWPTVVERSGDVSVARLIAFAHDGGWARDGGSGMRRVVMNTAMWFADLRRRRTLLKVKKGKGKHTAALEEVVNWVLHNETHHGC